MTTMNAAECLKEVFTKAEKGQDLSWHDTSLLVGSCLALIEEVEKVTSHHHDDHDLCSVCASARKTAGL